MLNRIDHIVLTVSDLQKTCTFYKTVLGMSAQCSAAGRHSLHFSNQKINLREAAATPILPRAAHPVPGSADLCFIASVSLEEIIAHVQSRGITIELGPVERNGALGSMRSIYLRDPDFNLLEISEYGQPPTTP